MIHLIWKTAKSFDLYSPSKNTVPDPADLSLCESTAGRYKINEWENCFYMYAVGPRKSLKCRIGK